MHTQAAACALITDYFCQHFCRSTANIVKAHTGPGSIPFAVQVTSCAPLFVEVKPDASYTAVCSGDAAVCKGFQTSVSSGDLHLELSNTPQSSTPTSILVTLPAAQLNKVVNRRVCTRWPVPMGGDH